MSTSGLIMDKLIRFQNSKIFHCLTFYYFNMEISKLIIDSHQETARKNVARLYNYIQEGKDVNMKDLHDNTPLHVAAANGDKDVVDILLDYGADTEAPNNMGWTPLMQAARSGHKTIVEKLIKFGADVNATNKYGLTALTLASASGQDETVHCLLTELKKRHKYEKELCEISKDLKEPLVIATLFENHDTVKYLLNEGADINSSLYKIKVSPLHCAAASGNPMIVKTVLSSGADSTLKNFGNYLAINIAAVHYNAEVMEMLKSQSQRCSKNENYVNIFDIVKNGDLTMMKEHLAKNSFFAQIENEDGWTPLMEVAVLNHLPIAKLLLQYGCNVNAQDFINGWTPLMQAIFHRNVEMAIILCDAGANLGIRNRAGYSALDIAKEINNTEIIQCLSKVQESESLENWKSNLLPEISNIETTSTRSMKNRDYRSASISGPADNMFLKNKNCLSPFAFQVEPCSDINHCRDEAYYSNDFLAYDVEEMTIDAHLQTYLNTRRISEPGPCRTSPYLDPYVQGVGEQHHHRFFPDASPLFQRNFTEYDDLGDVMKRIERKEKERLERQKRYEVEYMDFMTGRECACNIKPELDSRRTTPPIETEPDSEYDSLESVARRIQHRFPGTLCDSCNEELKTMKLIHGFVEVDISFLRDKSSRVCHAYPFKYPHET